MCSLSPGWKPSFEKQESTSGTTRIKSGSQFDILIDDEPAKSLGDVFDLVARSKKGTMLDECRKSPNAEFLRTLPPETLKMLDSIPLNSLYRLKKDAPYFGSCGGSIVLPLRYSEDTCELDKIVVAVLWRPPCSTSMGSAGCSVGWDDGIPFEVMVEPVWLNAITKEEFYASLN